MNQEEVKKILHDQLQLIAERSKEASKEELAQLSEAMGMIANSLLINYSE